MPISMQQHEVQLSGDHLERQARCGPEAAIAELVWNGLDAGGDLVEVRFEASPLGGIEALEVRDHGSGIDFADLDRAFGTIGKSLKLERLKTEEGRVLHGTEGRGRFKALALGTSVRWSTTYCPNGQNLSYEVVISAAKPRTYTTSDKPVEAPASSTGTVVRVEGVDLPSGKLVSDRTRQYLTERFALYLRTYPSVTVRYDTRAIDPAAAIANLAEYELEPEEDGDVDASLCVIEWTFELPNKKLLIADTDGFTWHEMLAGVQARDIFYTAYLRFDEAKKWVEAGRFTLGELDKEVTRLVDRAKDALRKHMRARLAAEAQEVVERWKEEKIYPYEGEEAATVVEQAERQVFDIVASRVHRFHEPFRSADVQSRHLTLQLVRQALESNPTSLRTIFDEVLRLPRAFQDELASLLQDTSLTGIIVAAREVRDRLRAITGFDEILFSKHWKQRLRERTQLHRLLVHHLWLFGDEYTLDTDDERLRAVLKKHLHHLGRELLAEEADPKLIDDKDGIPDLMISRAFDRDRGRKEHLVIELKRPKIKLGAKEITQIKKYALAVVGDERFSKFKVTWKFVVLGNDWDEFAEQEASERSKPYGCIGDHDTHTVWMSRWSDVLHEAKSRYDFFSERLEVEASTDQGIQHLRQNYPQLMTGKGLTKKQEQAVERQTGGSS